MISDAQFEKVLGVFQKRMDAVNTEYIKSMGEHLKDIGRLLPSDVNRLKEMRRLRTNMREVQRMLADAADTSIADVDKIMRGVAASNVEYARVMFGAASQAISTKHIAKIINAQLLITSNTFKNLARTTIESAAYRNAIDVACSAVQGGVTDYNSAIRRVLRNAAKDGIKVVQPTTATPGSKDWLRAVRRGEQIQYESGYRRRLDSAVRQNVLDGVRSVNNAIMQQIGKDVGADGVEISAHELCAEDHLPYQGRQFSTKEFDDIQDTLKRRFGMWNCMHTIHPIILGVSKPAYSARELAEFESRSTSEVAVGGKTMSRYEWTQEQRRTETAIRWERDIQTAGKAAGDDFLVRESRQKEQALIDYYGKISEGAGVVPKRERFNMRR